MIQNTSLLAYFDQNLEKISQIQAKIIKIIGKNVVTDGELCEHFTPHEIKVWQPRARRNELVKMGYIIDTGINRRCLTTGRMCKTWALVRPSLPMELENLKEE